MFGSRAGLLQADARGVIDAAALTAALVAAAPVILALAQLVRALRTPVDSKNAGV